nr:YcnI family protein [Nocardioides sp. MAH-18]
MTRVPHRDGVAAITRPRRRRTAVARPAARWLLRGTAPAVALLGLAVAAPATAHVTLTPSTTQAGEPAVLRFAIGHGCDGSATTAVTIRIPEPITAVTPTRHPLWDVEQEVVPLDPPVVDAHGARLTERVAAVTFRAQEPLPEGERDVLEIALVLPPDAGTTLSFPTIQTCEQGQSAWTEVPAGGQDPEQLDRPAPTLVVTPDDPGADGAASAVDTLTAVRADTDPSGRGNGEAPLLAVGAFGLGLLATLLAIAALARQRRRS